MNKSTKNIKVTISISPKFHSQLQIQAEALNLTVNTLLKQSALSAFNKSEITFLTSEQQLIIQNFTLNQIQMSKTIQQINERLGRNSKAFPVDKLLAYFKIYHETFVQLIEDLKASK